jgi:hypothetical protein
MPQDDGEVELRAERHDCLEQATELLGTCDFRHVKGY